jgi:hypothetical protein
MLPRYGSGQLSTADLQAIIRDVCKECDYNVNEVKEWWTTAYPIFSAAASVSFAQQLAQVAGKENQFFRPQNFMDPLRPLCDAFWTLA